MFGFQSLKLSLLLTWMLLFPAQTQQYSKKTVTVGEDVTLTCEVFRQFQDKCSSTTWIFANSIKTVTLYENEKLDREAGSKSDRLSLADKCSLVIKKVTEEDAGDYTCRLYGFKDGHVPESSVRLSVTNAQTQHYSEKTVTVGEDVTLTCEGFRELHDKCYNTTWLTGDSTGTVILYEHGKVKEYNASKSDRLSVTEKCSLVIKKVTVEDAGYYTCRQFDTSEHLVSASQVHLSVTNEKTSITIKPRPTTTTTTTATKKASTIPPTATITTPPIPTTAMQIVAAVGFSALLITTVIIIRWKKTKRNKTPTCDTPELDWNPAGTRSGPETNQDAADPPDVVHYASISYTNNTRARVHGGDHDDSTVTYSTVGAPAAASTDPSGLYATVQKTT